MRSMIFACLLGPALALGLAVGIAAFGELTASPYHPATCLPMVADRLEAVATAASELVRDLVEGFTAPFRARVHRTIPPEPMPH